MLCSFILVPMEPLSPGKCGTEYGSAGWVAVPSECNHDCRKHNKKWIDKNIRQLTKSLTR